MIKFGLALTLLGVCLASHHVFRPDLDQHWEAFKVTYNKRYEREEEISRRLIWEKNVDTIEKHNLEYYLGLHTFTLGLNKFADLHNTEFRRIYNGYRYNATTHARKKNPVFLPPANLNLPDSVDWRKEGYVTPIKDQAQCGSCWAFSATGSLEGQHFKATNKLVSLSEQNLVDCSTDEGNLGCSGGLMDQAFDYVKKNGGIDTEKSYPYEAVDGKCRFNANSIGATLTGYVDIPSGDENALKKAVATVGPISVAIDASSDKFQLYSGGIYNDKQCSSEFLDHGVLAVGYGSQKNKDYWLVKNSWGTSWGIDGYIKMSRNKDNQCGIATQASYPLV